jgi:uncharacterized protein (DUF697 family)
MPGWSDFGNIWKMFRELDIRPIAEEAERPLVLAFVGAAGAGKSTMIAAMRHDQRAREQVITPTLEVDLTDAAQLSNTDLIVLVIDATRHDFSTEANLYRQWKTDARNVVIFYNKMDAVVDAYELSASFVPWSDARIAFGSALDHDSLSAEFVPRVLETLRDRHLSLARHYPIFRLAVARELINDTSLANATYSIGTGLAEVIPVLTVPFNVADMFVLTKNQALMVYKLGLALGLSTKWRDHMAEFGSVVGVGFLWRQLARELVGLIPAWGLVPKVAIAYAGTYAVGEAILRWYQTGHKTSGKGMREIYADALARGRQVAQDLIARTPKPALPKLARPALPKPRGKIVCPNCAKSNPGDAKFCAYCATALESTTSG